MSFLSTYLYDGLQPMRSPRHSVCWLGGPWELLSGLFSLLGCARWTSLLGSGRAFSTSGRTVFIDCHLHTAQVSDNAGNSHRPPCNFGNPPPLSCLSVRPLSARYTSVFKVHLTALSLGLSLNESSFQSQSPVGLGFEDMWLLCPSVETVFVCATFQDLSPPPRGG